MGESDEKGDNDWSLTRALAMHVLNAAILGLAVIGDEDGLIEKTFSNVPVKDRSHAYWAVFRGWSDAERPVLEKCGHRLALFWEWRLREIERSMDASVNGEEAEGLLWFLAAPYVPPSDAIRLGRLTALLDTGRQHIRHGTWGRLAELSRVDPDGTFEIVKIFAERELTADHIYLPYESVAPTLKAALTSGNVSTRKEASRLINRIGEHGHLEYGKLLSLDGR